MASHLRKKSTRIPSLRRCNGRGFVELGGRRIYLGPWGEPQTQEAYGRTVAEWMRTGRQVPVGPREITVVETAVAYLEHASQYYRRMDGTLTTSIDAVREAIRVTRRLYGSLAAEDFGPLALRTVREVWIDRGLARKTVNYYTSNVKLMFKWAASHEMIGPEVYQALATVENLKAGRSAARETEPVLPVLEQHIEAIRPFVSRQVWALVQLQLLTGARGGELLPLRPVDLDTSGDVWIARLRLHKTSHQGKARTLYFGSRAQRILHEFLKNRPLTDCLFSPAEAEAERQGSRPLGSSRELGNHYRPDSYRNAIVRACRRAVIPVWTPHRLRHTAATRIRKEFGLDAAQVILGHSRADVTQIYAEIDQEKALRITKEVG